MSVKIYCFFAPCTLIATDTFRNVLLLTSRLKTAYM